MGVIRDGKYHPDENVQQPVGDHVVQSIASEGNISRQYEEHAHDLIQPYNPDGTPNEDFIDYYPDDAKRYGFIKEESEQ